MFDGKIGSRNVNFGGKKKDDKKSSKELMEDARKQRELRAKEKIRKDAAVLIQAKYKARIVRKAVIASRKRDFDKKISDISALKAVLKQKQLAFSVPLEVLDTLLHSLLSFYDVKIDSGRLQSMQQLLMESFVHKEAKFNFMTLITSQMNPRSAMYSVENIKLRRVKKIVALSLQLLTQHELVGGLNESQLTTGIEFISAVFTPTEATATTVLQPLLSCLLADEASRSLLLLSLSDSGENTGSSGKGASPVRTVLLSILLSAVKSIDQYNEMIAVNRTDSTMEIFKTLLVYRETALSRITVNIFSIPNLARKPLFAPLLTLLGDNRYFNFLNTLQIIGTGGVSGNTVAEQEQQLLIVSNLVTVFIGSNVNDTAFMNTLLAGDNNVLLSIISQIFSSAQTSSGNGNTSNKSALSVHKLLFYVQHGTEISHLAESAPYSVPELDELSREYALANGAKKLEYRVLALSRQIAGAVTIQNEGAVVEAFSGLVRLVSSKPFVSALMNIIGSERTDSTSSSSGGSSVEMDVVGDSISTRSTSSTSSSSTSGYVRSVLSTTSLYSSLFTQSPSELESALFQSHVNFVTGGGANINSSNGVSGNIVSSVLNHMIFSGTGSSSSSSLVSRLWTFITTHFAAVLPLLATSTGSGSTIDQLLRHPDYLALCSQLSIAPDLLYRDLYSLLHVFCTLAIKQLSVLDDHELLVAQRVVSVSTLQEVVLFLKQWLHNMYWQEPLAMFVEQKTSFYDMISGAVDIVGNYISAVNSAANSNVNTNKYMSSYLSSNSSSSSSATISGVNHTQVLLLKSNCQVAATKLFNLLCYRNERHPYLDLTHYQWPQLSPSDLSLLSGGAANAGADGVETEGEGAMIAKNPKVMGLLTFIPQVVPFEQRVFLFQKLLDFDKALFYNTTEGGSLLSAMMGIGSVQMTIHRDNLVEDAFRALNHVGAKLKGKVQVEFVSAQGYHEAGIDGGGLFKEFIDCFSKAVFHTSIGVSGAGSTTTAGGNSSSSSSGSSGSSGSARVEDSFSQYFVPTSSQLLTINPALSNHAPAASKHTVSGVGSASHVDYYHFIGKILGKALYERILLESEFAGGLLNILLGRSNSLDDLYYQDEVLYRSLMHLKRMASEGVVDIESLELYFEVSTPHNNGTYELIPNGSRTKVTRQNVHQYIHLLSHYKQHKSIAEASYGLVTGFRSVIPLEFIRMFSTRELQRLISGEKKRINMADFKAHIHYASGYHESQPYIQGFWRIVEDMSVEDQGNLLKFVTSCSRQPLLGFQSLSPSFCIQKVPAVQHNGGAGGEAEGDRHPTAFRLPTAATCMNLLKLPFYDNNVDVLREKLLYAIRSNSGFELS